MTSEIRQCQNCTSEFVIEPDDFAFYDKLKVPPPTWCPECREKRRMIFRAERSLHKRLCNLCKHEIISMYPKESPYNVYCPDCWWSDKWDPLSYGMAYDFEKNFFEQFGELMKSVPRPALEVQNNMQSPYTNFTWESKNCYLSPSTLLSENIFFTKCATKSQECFDCLEVVECELCYQCSYATRCHNSQYLMNCRDCIDSAFLFDCANCQNCLLSSNLRNKRYCILNEQYSREAYFEKLKSFRLHTIEGARAAKAQFLELKARALHKHALITKAVNSTGNNLENVKEAKMCFDMFNLENVRYCARGYNAKDTYDIFGVDDTQWAYESVNEGLFSAQDKFCIHTHTHCLDAQYSDYCRAASHIFGCVSVRNKQYCILNRQYDKDSFEALRARIIEQMKQKPYVDARGREYRYGEFFPVELSPFAYNEAVTQEYFPLRREEIEAAGYRWKPAEDRHYRITKIGGELPQESELIPESIMDEIIGCEHAGKCGDQCTTAFKIIPEEFQFYRRLSIPLPTLCPNCRHYERVAMRPPVKLWQRACMCAGVKSRGQIVHSNSAAHFHGGGSCPNTFETPYAPEREEVVYCERCYQSEVA